MKIVFVIPDMPGGGSEKVISLLANEYIKQNIQVAIMMFAGNEVAYELDPRIEVFSVAGASAGNALVRLKRVWKMRTYFRKNKDCYIFSFSTMGTAFCVMATFFMKRYILVSERSDPHECPNAKWRDWAYAKADRLVFQTREGMEYFPSNIQEKSVVIPNPVDENIPYRTGNVRSKTIVSAGRLEIEKNYPLLLRAFKKFQLDYPEYSLHIYGAGTLETELKELSVSLGLGEKVIWHGFTRNVKEEILDSGMFILSSDHEGMSNSMIEALAMGIPTIATDCPIGGCRAYIEDGVNGLLVPIKEEAALVGAMKKIAGDDTLAEQLSDQAVKVRDTYSTKAIADKLLEAIGKRSA